MSDGVTRVPAGWYPDPVDAASFRFWDGVRWTEHHSRAGSQVRSPSAPEGTSAYTSWIWLIVLLPVVSTVSSFLALWSIVFGDPLAPLNGGWDDAGSLGQDLTVYGYFLSPWDMLSTLISLVIAALVVVFAALDYRELSRRGVPSPFHWAWSFLGIVYPIGRSIVIVRRVGSGWAPMVVAIALLVIDVTVTTWLTVSLMSVTFDQVWTLRP